MQWQSPCIPAIAGMPNSTLFGSGASVSDSRQTHFCNAYACSRVSLAGEIARHRHRGYKTHDLNSLNNFLLFIKPLAMSILDTGFLPVAIKITQACRYQNRNLFGY